MTVVRPSARFGTVARRGRSGHRDAGEAPSRRHARSTAGSSSSSRRARSYRRRRSDLGERRPAGARAGRAARRATSTTATGSPWTPPGSASSSKSCGSSGQRALEGVVSAGAWRGRGVLVTGHTGFKGAWLALWLRGARRDRRGPGAGSADRTEPARAAPAWTRARPRRSARQPRRRARVARADARGRLPPRGAEPRAAGVRRSGRHVRGQRARHGAPPRGLRACPRVRAVSWSRATRSTSPRPMDVRTPRTSPLGGLDPYSASKAARRTRRRPPTGAATSLRPGSPWRPRGRET